MKDKNGLKIRIGDVVAHAITMNQRQHSKPWTIHVVRDSHNGLILDGATGHMMLGRCNPHEMCVITPETDLRELLADWHKKFSRRGDLWDRQTITTIHAHDFVEFCISHFKLDPDCSKENLRMAIEATQLPERYDELIAAQAAIEQLRKNLMSLTKVISHIIR